MRHLEICSKHRRQSHETTIQYVSHCTHFLAVAILVFFKKSINFVITVAFYNDTAYVEVLWFGD